MKQLVQQLVGSTRRLLTQPMGELNRWQKTARYAVGIARYGANELKEDRASQMAAALTYRTIFSLIPVFVLSLLVFNAFGGFESVGGDLRDTVYDYLGLTSIQIENTNEPEMDVAAGPPVVGPDGQTSPSPFDGETANAAATNNKDTQARVDQLLTDLQNQVASVNFTSIGIVGLVVLIWAALSLVVSLENCFNRVYHAPQGRPWHLRITIYWAVITLGPVLLVLSFYVTNQLINTASALTGVGWVIGLFTPFFSLAATWLLLVLIYGLLPAVKVQLRAALIGALVAAVLWELSKWGFRLYVQRAVGYSALYGSLGLVPLFLLWLYVTWMVILFGLEISYIVQTVKNTRFLRAGSSDQDADRLFDTSAVLRVAHAVARRFEDGEGATLDQLQRDTALPPRVVQRLTAALESAGHLHRGQTSDEDADPPYQLSRPAERITLAELLKTARSTAISNPSQDLCVTRELAAAEEQAVAGRTLRDLLSPAPGQPA
ncbi:MAG: YhjD/YihY/BrkB family envelope integrity protein [Planctomycetota bacterium]